VINCVEENLASFHRPIFYGILKSLIPIAAYNVICNIAIYFFKQKSFFLEGTC